MAPLAACNQHGYRIEWASEQALVKRPQVSLRDLFWLVLVAGVGVGWYMGHVQQNRRLSELMAEWFFFGPPIGSSLSDESKSRAAALETLPKLDDGQLSEHLEELCWPLHNDPRYEPCLMEMARRGMHDDLQKHCDRLRANEPFPENCEALIALRRAQGKADPLKVHVECVLSRYDPHSAPKIRVTMENIDAGRETVYFVDQGDDDNWQIEMTDQSGRRVSDSNYRASPFEYITIGSTPIRSISYGDKEWPSNFLDVRHFVSPPLPGKYLLQVLHNGGPIAREPNLDGLIILKSEPIDVFVEWPDGEARDYSSFPPITILSATVVASLWLGVRWLARMRSKDRHAAPLFRWRDLAWLTLVMMLAAAWLVDNRFQASEIQRLTPDAKANWTMRLAG